MSTLIKTADGWKEVANLSSSDVVRNPDNARRIELTSAQLRNGFVAPEDGIITGSVAVPAGYTSNEIWALCIRENNKNYMQQLFSGLNEFDKPVYMCINAGQTLIQTSNAQFDCIYSHMYFIPYKVQKVRVDIPDWSNAVNFTYQSLISGFTCPKDGLLIMPYIATTQTGANGYNVYINRVIVATVFSSDGLADIRNGQVQVPVAAGDVVTIDSEIITMSNAGSFIPYKVS